MLPNGRLHIRIQHEVERRGETNRPQHPERILIEGGFRIERRRNSPRLQILQPPAGQIEDRTVPVHQQRVDGEITPQDVLPESAGTHLRLATGGIVCLGPARDELQRVRAVNVEVRGPEPFEENRRGSGAERATDRGCESGRPLAFDQDVHLAYRSVAIEAEQPVTNIPADHKRADTGAPGFRLDRLEGSLPVRQRGWIDANRHRSARKRANSTAPISPTSSPSAGRTIRSPFREAAHEDSIIDRRMGRVSRDPALRTLPPSTMT